MPYKKATKDVARLLEEGMITEDDINRMVKSSLRTFISMKSFEGEKKPLSGDDYRRMEEVALNTAREGMVLLRNDNNLLPIDKTNNQKILALGEFLFENVSGGGAARVKGYNNLSLKDALEIEFGEQIIFTRKAKDEEIKHADIVILSTGTRDSEGSDRPYNLPQEQEDLVQRVSRLNPNTIVLVTSGSGIKMSAWDEVNSILYTWYMGQNGAIALAEILSGKTNPSGKLPATFEKKFEDSPAYGYIPEGEELYTGFGTGPKKHPVYDVNYKEGIFVGYRWFDQNNIEPEFCFGHGLSYTSFEYSNLKLSKVEISGNEDLRIQFMLKNTGNMDGAETVQVYLHDILSSVPRPPKELKGFEKIFLKTGEEKEVILTLHRSDFSFWHPETREWTLEEGDFEILVGASCSDIRLKEKVRIY
jgi:beta-glucosidase